MVFPKRPPGFWAVFPNREPLFPNVPVPKVPLFPKEKLVVVGLNADDVVAVDVPKPPPVPKLPKFVAVLVPNPVVPGLLPKIPWFVDVFVPNVNAEVVVGFILKDVWDLFWNNPIDWFCGALKPWNPVFAPKVVGCWLGVCPNIPVCGVAKNINLL